MRRIPLSALAALSIFPGSRRSASTCAKFKEGATQINGAIRALERDNKTMQDDPSLSGDVKSAHAKNFRKIIEGLKKALEKTGSETDRNAQPTFRRR